MVRSHVTAVNKIMLKNPLLDFIAIIKNARSDFTGTACKCVFPLFVLTYTHVVTLQCVFPIYLFLKVHEVYVQ